MVWTPPIKDSESDLVLAQAHGGQLLRQGTRERRLSNSRMTGNQHYVGSTVCHMRMMPDLRFAVRHPVVWDAVTADDPSELSRAHASNSRSYTRGKSHLVRLERKALPTSQPLR